MKGENGFIGQQGNKGDTGTNGRNGSNGPPGIDVCACIYMHYSLSRIIGYSWYAWLQRNVGWTRKRRIIRSKC